MLIWPKGSADDTEGDGPLQMAAIGPMSKEDEHYVTVLKSGFLLQRVMDGTTGKFVDVPPDAVAHVIFTINKETSHRMI